MCIWRQVFFVFVTGVITPICVVSSAQFLTRTGWVDLHNNSYTEPPFRLFRDEGRTFLQVLYTMCWFFTTAMLWRKLARYTKLLQLTTIFLF